MESLLIESAIRATLVAAGTGAVLQVMRIRTAPARHAFTGLGPDAAIRFSSDVVSCGGSFRMAALAPIARFASTAGAGSATTARHVSVDVYPHGLAAVSIPVDFARTVHFSWELRARAGAIVDEQQIGRPADGRPASSYPFFDTTDVRCTKALRPDTYVLTTAVTLSSGEIESETVTFDVK